MTAGSRGMPHPLFCRGTEAPSGGHPVHDTALPGPCPGPAPVTFPAGPSSPPSEVERRRWAGSNFDQVYSYYLFYITYLHKKKGEGDFLDVLEISSYLWGKCSVREIWYIIVQEYLSVRGCFRLNENLVYFGGIFWVGRNRLKFNKDIS